MPLRKLMKSSTARVRSIASPAKTPSPDATLDAPVDSTPTSVQPLPAVVSPPTISPPTATSAQPLPNIVSPPTISPSTTNSVQPLPTIMSTPNVSAPSATDPLTPSIIIDICAPDLFTPEPTTPIRGPNTSATAVTTPMRATERFDHMSTPLSNPLMRELHENLDKQNGLSRGYRSREAEIDKTRELIAEMTKPSKILEKDQQAVEIWLAVQERWIKWLEKDMEKVKAEFYALEAAELVLRKRIEGNAGLGVGKAGEDGKVEVVLKGLGELKLGEKGKGVKVVDGGVDGQEQKGGSQGADGKSEGRGITPNSRAQYHSSSTPNLYPTSISLPTELEMDYSQAHTQDLIEMQIRIMYEMESISRALHSLIDESQPPEVRFTRERQRLIKEFRDAEMFARVLIHRLMISTGILVCRK
ncbi:hypothetical protein MMC17_004952 [Xylographa soralifera]|nr:hypothetical protein [Xylographa soralifera]